MVKNKLPCLMHKVLLFLAIFLPFISSHLSAQERRPGDLFPPDKIFLLEEPRDWQDTEEIMERLYLKTGDIVADIGAGSGYFTIPLASRVGEKGLVFAEDIQIQMINYISKKSGNTRFEECKSYLLKNRRPFSSGQFFQSCFPCKHLSRVGKTFLTVREYKKRSAVLREISHH